MKILFILALRNIWRNRRRSLITISSILFAVMLAIVLSSLQKGSYERMIDSMVKYTTGYIQIQDIYYDDEPSIDNSLLLDDELNGILGSYSESFYYVPRIQNFALVATEQNTRGSMVIGIDPESEEKINDIEEKLILGDFVQSGDEDIVVAEGLANIINATVGDTLVLLSQGFQGSTAAGKFRIKGIVDLLLPELNNNTIFMSLNSAQLFYNAEDRLSTIMIMPYNPKDTDKLSQEIQSKIDPEWYTVFTWEYLLADLLKLMKFDMAGTVVMLAILYTVIAFGLFGTILTMIIERQREFAMLISLGMKRYKLAVVSFIETILISLIGAVSGMLLSIPIIAYFYYNPIPLTGEMAIAMEDYGFEPVMPFSADPNIFWAQAQVIFIISLIIGFYPVYKVFKLDIMKARHH